MPNLEVVFTTRGVNNLLSSLTKISKQFDQLDKNAGKFKGFTKGANTLVTAAKILDKSAAGLNKAAANLKVSAAMLLKATGGKPLTHATGGGSGGGSRGSNKSWSQLIKNLVYSTRVGNIGKGGVGLFPLIGKILPLIEKLGPVGVAVAGIASAGLALGELGRQAAELGQEFSRMRFSLGSSPGTAAGLATAGAAIGLSPSDVAGIAASIQSHITGDPYGRAMGLQAGVMNIGGPFGNPDWGKQMQDIISYLRKIPDWTNRVIAARTLGAEGVLPITQLSNKQYGKIAEDAAVRAQIFTPDMEQKSAVFMASIGRVGEAFQNLLGAIGSPLLTELTDWANGFADVVNKLALFLSKHGQEIKGIFDIWVGSMRWTAMDFGGGFKQMKEGWGELTGPKKTTDALNNHQQALEDNTEALIRLNGTFGRGERADRAMPSGMNGQFLRSALTAGGIRLSQF